MRFPIRLTLILVLAFAVGCLIVGALVPLPAPHSPNSPYLSALSDVAVPSAEAVQCNTICYRANQTDPWQCIHDFELGGGACHKFGNNQCEVLFGLCPN